MHPNILSNSYILLIARDIQKKTKNLFRLPETIKRN